MAARSPNRVRFEPGRLEQHPRRLFADFRVDTTHDACDCDCSRLVGYDHRFGIQLTLDVVDRCDLLARCRQAHDDLVAGELVGVEGVGWVAKFQHDIIRDIDVVIDRPQSGCDETALEPARRRLDRHILKEGVGEAPAMFRGGDLDSVVSAFE